MSARTTRRRSARNRDAQSPSDDEHQPQTNGAVVMNGNGSAHADPAASSSGPDGEEEERENIFLFWPNLIGTSCRGAANARCPSSPRN